MRPTTYGQFGVRFLRETVTAERVRGAILRIAGDRIDFGPLVAGPGGVATATAIAQIEAVSVIADYDAVPIRFTAEMRLAVDLCVDVAGAAHAYRCDVVVRLGMAARPGDPLMILIDVDEVGESDVAVVVAPRGLRARMVQRIGGLDRAVRRAVRTAIDDLLRSPRAAELRAIDVRPLIEVAWPSR